LLHVPEEIHLLLLPIALASTGLIGL
jgi:hypothetical protein